MVWKLLNTLHAGRTFLFAFDFIAVTNKPLETGVLNLERSQTYILHNL
jgi:hypothetical protein